MKRPARIVLASRSPQRRDLLERAGVHFDVIDSAADELTAGAPDQLVVANALIKARAVAAQLDLAETLVIGADTVVVVDGDVLGKPRDAAEAREFIAHLAGHEQHVYSGIAVLGPGVMVRTAVESTMIRFRALTDQEIDDYVATGEWQERSGGYAIQRGAAALVEEMRGDESNVVGLPVDRLFDLAPELAPAPDPAA